MSKPIMVKIKSEKDGYLTLSENELKRIIDEAYNMGYTDGCSCFTYQPHITNPYNPIVYTSNTTTSTKCEVTNEETNN